MVNLSSGYIYLFIVIVIVIVYSIMKCVKKKTVNKWNNGKLSWTWNKRWKIYKEILKMFMKINMMEYVWKNEKKYVGICMKEWK